MTLAGYVICLLQGLELYAVKLAVAVSSLTKCIELSFKMLVCAQKWSIHNRRKTHATSMSDMVLEFELGSF